MLFHSQESQRSLEDFVSLFPLTTPSLKRDHFMQYGPFYLTVNSTYLIFTCRARVPCIVPCPCPHLITHLFAVSVNAFESANQKSCISWLGRKRWRSNTGRNIWCWAWIKILSLKGPLLQLVWFICDCGNNINLIGIKWIYAWKLVVLTFVWL